MPESDVLTLADFGLVDNSLFLLRLGRPPSGSNSVVECQLPKLDVAGSTPVSRSNFSTTCDSPASTLCSVCARFSHRRAFLQLVDAQPVCFRLATAYRRFGNVEAMAKLIGDQLPIHTQRLH